MIGMKRLLIHMLMFMMLMPSLACGPFMSVDKAHATQMKSTMPDCAEMGMEKEKKQTSSDTLMLFKDCLHVDLQGTDNPVNLKSPSLSDNFPLFVVADVVLPDSFLPINANVIRGPPPDWPDISQTRPSILLTTQRLRV